MREAGLRCSATVTARGLRTPRRARSAAKSGAPVARQADEFTVEDDTMAT
jgi:hypothetical protein